MEVNLVNVQKKEVSSLEQRTYAPIPPKKPNRGVIEFPLLFFPLILTINVYIYIYFFLFFPFFPTI